MDDNQKMKRSRRAEAAEVLRQLADDVEARKVQRLFAQWRADGCDTAITFDARCDTAASSVDG